MKRRGSIIPGLLLILFGIFLLLERLDVYLLTWSLFLPLLAFLGGLMMWGRSISGTDRDGAFSGTLLVVLGGFFFLWNYGLLDRYWYLEVWPIFPTAFGLAFLALVLRNWRNWWALIFALPLLAVGLTAFAVHMRYVDWYTVEDSLYRMQDNLYYVREYYPVIFIVIGIMIIVSSIRRSRARRIAPPAE